MVYKCCLHEIGSHIELDSTYVMPEHIHYWIGRQYEADNKTVFIKKVMISQTRFEELFPEQVNVQLRESTD